MLSSIQVDHNSVAPRLDRSELPVAQNFPIVLVSIMSAFYQNSETLKYMMEWMRGRYRDSGMPIVYVCGDTVYRNTQHCLFPSEGRDPVEKGRTNWKKKYDDIINFFQNSENIAPEMDTYWELIKDDFYLKIKSFTDLSCDSTLNIEKLLSQFPSVPQDTLETLLHAIQALNINSMVETIALEFRQKNAGKITRQVRKHKGATKQISLVSDLVRSHLVELGIEPIKMHAIEEEMDEKNDELLESTRAYLAEEYAVFMNLSLPTDISSMAAKCKLNLSFLDGETSVSPVLYYPISATKGSDLIFNAFQKIRDLYIEFSEVLGLPILTHKANITDLVIPENMRLSRRPRSYSENQKNSKLSRSDDAASLTQNWFSIFSKPVINDREIEQIAESIIGMIFDYLALAPIGGEQSTVLRYKNGIECDVKVKKISNMTDINVGAGVAEAQYVYLKQAVQRMITIVKSGDVDELREDIVYSKLYDISLKMKYLAASRSTPLSVINSLPTR